MRNTWKITLAPIQLKYAVLLDLRIPITLTQDGLWLSQLHHGNPYTNKAVFSYWLQAILRFRGYFVLVENKTGTDNLRLRCMFANISFTHYVFMSTALYTLHLSEGVRLVEDETETFLQRIIIISISIKVMNTSTPFAKSNGRFFQTQK